MLLALQVPSKGLAQTVYTYAGGATANWSTPATWTTLSGSGTTYPGSDGSGTSDTADIENRAATTALTYDTGASGYVGTLNMFEATGGNFTTTLTLAQNLTLNQGGSLYTSFNTNNLEVINLGNSTLAIGNAAGSAANFTLGLAGATTLGGGTPITTTGTGSVAINGTLTVASGVTFGETINAPVALNTGTITISGNTSTIKNSLTIVGNFTSTGSSVLQSTGTTPANGTIVFQGATTTIGAGTTTAGGLTFSFLNSGTSGANQNVSLGALLPNMVARNANATGTVTKIFSSSATSASVGNAIDSTQLVTQKGSSALVFTLGSNLNLAAAQTTAFTFTFNNATAAAPEQSNIDLAGFAYNSTASSAVAFAPGNGSTAAGFSQINIINSGASSISGGNGIFQAASFALSSNDIGIGSGVILQANGGTGTVNNLGVVASGVTTISPTSTFYYAGAGTAGTPATLTSGRAIGALTVGNGTAASNLQLATATLPVAGNVTINSGSMLQLGGQVLSMTGTANLTGTGTVAGTTNNAASANNAVTFTGTGGIVPATNGTIGMLTLVGTQTLTLGANSNSLFDIVSASSLDQLIINGSNVAVVYNGLLTLNFQGSAPTSGSFQIASADALASGNFTNITSNVAGDSFVFDPATGVLSIVAVPEPATFVQAGMALALAFGVGAFKQIRRRAGCSC